MTQAQWITTIILILYPLAFAASFWFFRIGELQRQVIIQFMPTAIKSVKSNEKLSKEGKIEFAVLFIVNMYKSSHLPPYSRDIIRRIVEAELDE